MNLNGSINLSNEKELINVDQINDNDVQIFYPFYYGFYHDSSTSSTFSNQLTDYIHPQKIFEIENSLNVIPNNYIVNIHIVIPVCCTIVDKQINGIIASLRLDDSITYISGEGVSDLSSSYYDYGCISLNITVPKSSFSKLSLYLDDPEDTYRSSFKYYISIIAFKGTELLKNAEVQI